MERTRETKSMGSGAAAKGSATTTHHNVAVRMTCSDLPKAVYLALGILPDGTKEVLGLWVEQTEGAKFWLKVMTELKNRGVADILIAVVDGLKGFPEAITTTFAEAQIQTCIVHLIRNSLEFASWKDRKGLATELKTIYRAANAEAAAAALQAFEAGPWGAKYPPIAASWRRHWEQVIPFFAYPPEVLPDHLHHQRHRKPAHAAAQDHQDARAFPDRRGCGSSVERFTPAR